LKTKKKSTAIFVCVFVFCLNEKHPHKTHDQTNPPTFSNHKQGHKGMPF
jgi:hypothetical protein